MNWIKYFNSEVDNIQNKAYEACSIIFEKFENYTEVMYDVAIELEHSRRCGTLDQVDLINYSSNEKIQSLRNNVDISYKNFIKTIEKDLTQLLNNCCNHIKSYKDLNLLHRRVSITHVRLVNQVNSYLSLQFDEFKEQIEELFEIDKENEIDEIDEINEYNEYKDECIDDTDDTDDAESEIIEISKQKYNILKIFNYKDMEKLATNNNYIYKWSSGSHRVFEHTTSKKIVVIPSHDLGIGLSKKIQKQIYLNVS